MRRYRRRPWWAIERLHEDGVWRLQWSPHRDCWPRLFRTRAEARAEAALQRGPGWRLRAVKVRVVREPSGARTQR